VKRTQIYLDDAQDRLLTQRAAASGKTKSELIRSAIDQMLDTPTDHEARLAEFKAAADAAFGIAPYFTHEYLDELREPDRQRTDELAAHWHTNGRGASA
jgi:Arc/MetJ-type ribon-helix-helix transcriptional regulator